MEDAKLDGLLQEFDFSLLSPVREPLLKELLGRMERERGVPWPMAGRMSDEELDEVAAAGQEIASASHSLADLATELQAATGKFKV